MTNADIQYQKVVRLLQGMDKRLIRIEETLHGGAKQAKDRPVDIVIKTPKKVNAADG